MFEPNDQPLSTQTQLSVDAFMHKLPGPRPSEIYLVQGDRSTTTENDINLGIVNIVGEFAPLKPSEFVIKLQ